MDHNTARNIHSLGIHLGPKVNKPTSSLQFILFEPKDGLDLPRSACTTDLPKLKVWRIRDKLDLFDLSLGRQTRSTPVADLTQLTTLVCIIPLPHPDRFNQH
jgi:hypothetical protein